MTEPTNITTTTAAAKPGALETARERAIDVYDKTRDSAVATQKKATQKIAGSPLVALGAGLAVGALVAALLPRSKVEDRVLGPVGDRLTNSAKAAVDAAKTAGAERLAELNLTRDAGTEALQSVIRGAGEAAKAGANAAIKTTRKAD